MSWDQIALAVIAVSWLEGAISFARCKTDHDTWVGHQIGLFIMAGAIWLIKAVAR